MARLESPSRDGDQAQDQRIPLGSQQPKTGLTLLVPDPTMELAAIVQSLRLRGLRPVVAPLAQNVIEIVSNWRPRLTILTTGVADWRTLLRHLNRRAIRTVLIGGAEELVIANELGMPTIQVLSPARPSDIADAAELLAGPRPSESMPESIDIGPVHIDVRAGRAEIAGEKVRLPPKEFDILVALALEPGVPVPSSELIRRLWPALTSTTADDVHCHVSRLKALIGDRGRSEPLITNRRGFGYVLDPAAVPVE